ncbi:MAG: hypothetical protein KAG66_13055, partial [Methylococcales bacterium]|nr:hypothetical protein [Methylococcales bacterium]
EDSQPIGTADTIRTFGDRLGILGLVRAFGSIFHESGNVELVSPRNCAEELLKYEANLYFIGSRKINEPAGDLLKKVQRDSLPVWSFDPEQSWLHGDGLERDWPVALYKHVKKEIHVYRGTSVEQPETGKQVWSQDYGLVVRAPHPNFEDRIVLLMAGSHSLGTGAACLAATRSSLIRCIREKLNENTGHDVLGNKGLESCRSSFWVLVKGTVNPPGFFLDESCVNIEDAGVFIPE